MGRIIGSLSMYIFQNLLISVRWSAEWRLRVMYRTLEVPEVPPQSATLKSNDEKTKSPSILNRPVKIVPEIGLFRSPSHLMTAFILLKTVCDHVLGIGSKKVQ